MTDRELRKLSRGQLLQMLIDQMEENIRLREELEDARTQLRSREITVAECGSLAEAALALNDVFQAADAAARQYLENIQARAGQPKEGQETT